MSSGDSKFTILLIGDNNVGKGEILNSFKKDTNHFLTSVIGIDKVLIDMEINGQKISLMLWNTEDCAAKKIKTKNCPKVIDGVAFVFDPSNRESFENLKYWIHDVKQAFHTPVQYLIISKYRPKSKICVSKAEGKKFADSQNSAFALINGQSSANKALEQLAKNFTSRPKPQLPVRPCCANELRKTPSPIEIKKRLEKKTQKQSNNVAGSSTKVLPKETKPKTPKSPIKPTKTGAVQTVPVEVARLTQKSARNCTPQNLTNHVKPKNVHKCGRPPVDPWLAEMSEESSDETTSDYPQTTFHRKKKIQKHGNNVAGSSTKVLPKETKPKTPKSPFKPTKTGVVQTVPVDKSARNGTPQNLANHVKPKNVHKCARPPIDLVGAEMSEESSDETTSDYPQTTFHRNVYNDSKVCQHQPNMAFVKEIDQFINRLQELKLLVHCSDERFCDIVTNIKEDILKKSFKPDHADVPFPEAKIHLKKVLDRLGDIFCNQMNMPEQKNNNTDVQIIDALLCSHNKFLSKFEELETMFARDQLVIQCGKLKKLIIQDFCERVEDHDPEIVGKVKKILQQILNEPVANITQDSIDDLLDFDLSAFKTDPHRGNLGKGGYGTAWLAFNQSTGIVAIKCQQDAKHRDKFEKEAKLLRCASHPNIVQVFGCTELPSGRIAIVMEYMAGGALSAFLANRNQFGYHLKLRMCHDMASGLAFLHNIYERRRIAHNDIKPHNVLLTASLTCKLSDFGSCEMDDVTCSVSDTRCRGLEYTKAFAAPERLKHRGMRTSKAMDVFSFGMTVYCVLDEVKNPPRILDSERPKIPRCRRNNPEDDDCEIYNLLKDTVERCWREDPYERPPMVAVRNRLYSRISSSDATICLRQVVEACERHKPFHPAYDELSWVPLVQVINT